LGKNLDKVIQTPNLDKLAFEGVYFSRFYHVFPICVPSRATLLTGKVPQSNGILSEGGQLPLNQSIISKILKDSGYETGIFGKCHLVGDKEYDLDSSSNVAPNTDGYLEKMGFGERVIIFPDRGYLPDWYNYTVIENGVKKTINH
jgi:arylsulfatase A-like enzyme